MKRITEIVSFIYKVQGSKNPWVLSRDQHSRCSQRRLILHMLLKNWRIVVLCCRPLNVTCYPKHLNGSARVNYFEFTPKLSILCANCLKSRSGTLKHWRIKPRKWEANKEVSAICKGMCSCAVRSAYRFCLVRKQLSWRAGEAKFGIFS